MWVDSIPTWVLKFSNTHIGIKYYHIGVKVVYPGELTKHPLRCKFKDIPRWVHDTSTWVIRLDFTFCTLWTDSGSLIPCRFYIYPPGYTLVNASVEIIYLHGCMYKYIPMLVYVVPRWYMMLNNVTNRKTKNTSLLHTQVGGCVTTHPYGW